MTSMWKKRAIAAVTALALGLGVTATSTPASAFWRGGGGWHGGGWHGGGWRGGYWGGGGWGWGAPVAAGVLGGLALGAVAASAYPYGYGYGGCYLQSQPAYNGWGQFVGYRPVRVCY